MSFSIEFADESNEYNAKIKVVGCGGSGGNAINAMMNFGLEGVEFVAINTDAQALNANSSPVKIPIGGAVTKGLGAGADPDKGRKAALEDVTRIKEAIAGADMVFVTAGMGGGTGTGAAPIVAQVAREEGALTVGVVTKPFEFEGKRRMRQAEYGMAMLAEHVDTLITIPNEKLLTLDEEDLSFLEAFRKADEVLYQAVKGISDLITQSGIVNVDFADVKAIMQNMGRALMGTGCAKGQDRARLAVEMAVNSPLLDDISVAGATGILINFVGGTDLKVKEMRDAAQVVQQQAHDDANIIWGATVDESMGDLVRVTVIATGFDRDMANDARAAAELARPATFSSLAAKARPISYAPPAAQPQVAPRAAQVPAREDAATAYARASRPPPSGFAARDAAQALGVPRSERMTMPSGVDNEWDAPAFLRRGQ